MDEFTFRARYHKLWFDGWDTSKTVRYGRRAARRTQKVHLGEWNSFGTHPLLCECGRCDWFHEHDESTCDICYEDYYGRKRQ